MMKVNFKANMNGLTQQVRDFWGEGNYDKAFALLDCFIGLPAEIGLGIIRGTKKLTEEQSWTDDNWTPDVPFYPDPDELPGLAGKGAKYDDDVQRLEDMVIMLAQRLTREGQGEGTTQEEMEHILRLMPESALNRQKIQYRAMGNEATPQQSSLVFGDNEPGFLTSQDLVRNISRGEIEAVREQMNIEARLKMVSPDVQAFLDRQSSLFPYKLPCPVKNLEGIKGGYIIENGKFYPCKYMEHDELETALIEKGSNTFKLVKVAGSQIIEDTTKIVWHYEYYPNDKQQKTIIDWCLANNEQIPDMNEE